MSYTNSDGLYVLTHGGKGDVIRNGSTAVGIRKTLIVEFNDLSTLTDTTWSPTPNDAFIPSGAIILKATTVVTTAGTSGGSAVLDIGTYQADGTITDDDGIDAAIAVAALTDGAVVDNDGAVVGTQVSADAYIGASYDTAAFTAGAAKVVIEYIEVE
jgi:hypothetical protein